MKISVITWDAEFREYTHFIECMCRQRLPVDQFEIIWVDYHDSSSHIRKAMQNVKNGRILTLGFDKSNPWHLGKCINAGLAESSGDLLIIPDGDIFVPDDFLEQCYKAHRSSERMVLYFRRFDEPEQQSCDKSRSDLHHLKQVCKLTNPTNYAGCLTLRRETLLYINGYETHAAFSGPGCNGMEMYIRLRNAGASVSWSDIPIYHPWHPITGQFPGGERQRAELQHYMARYEWIMPYAGIYQSWIMHSREFSLEYRASEESCNRYLDNIPEELKHILR